MFSALWARQDVGAKMIHKRYLEARLDGSTPGESRLSKSAHPREAETPRILEAVPGDCAPDSAWPVSFRR
jgi:hypothetical protein